VQLALKLPFRNKPLLLQSPKQFFSSLFGQEAILYRFDAFSFWIRLLSVLFAEGNCCGSSDKNLNFIDAKKRTLNLKIAVLDYEGFGENFSSSSWNVCNRKSSKNRSLGFHLKGHSSDGFTLPGIYWDLWKTAFILVSPRVEKKKT